MTLMELIIAITNLIIDKLTSIPFGEGIQKIEKKIETSPPIIKVEGLPGASRALFLARLIQSISRPIVVITPDQNTGEKLVGDLKYFYYFYNIKKVFRFFPTWELLPYENLSPIAEISGERLEILNLLQRNEAPFLVVPIEAIMQCLEESKIYADDSKKASIVANYRYCILEISIYLSYVYFIDF